jgi:hypothetical protein
MKTAIRLSSAAALPLFLALAGCTAPVDESAALDQDEAVGEAQQALNDGTCTTGSPGCAQFTISFKATTEFQGVRACEVKELGGDWVPAPHCGLFNTTRGISAIRVSNTPTTVSGENATLFFGSVAQGSTTIVGYWNSQLPGTFATPGCDSSHTTPAVSSLSNTFVPTLVTPSKTLTVSTSGFSHAPPPSTHYQCAFESTGDPRAWATFVALGSTGVFTIEGFDMPAPALGASCAAIHASYPGLPSDMYWVGAGGSAQYVYCDMSTTGTVDQTVLAPTTTPAYDLAVDGTSGTVYWTGGLDGSVWSLPVAGGVPATLVHKDAAGSITRWITFSGGRVAWNGLTALQSLIPSSSASLAAVGDLQGAYTTDLSSLGSTAYFIADLGLNVRALQKASLAGGATTTLAVVPDYPHTTALDGTFLYFASDLQDNTSSGVISKVSIPGGGAVTVLKSALPSVNVMTAYSGNLYFTDASQRVMRMNTSTGALITIASAEDNPRGIATDGVNVYWTNYGHWDSVAGAMTTGSVKKAPVGGGAATTLSSVESTPTRIAVSGGYAYWVTSDAVKRIAK